MSIQLQNVRKYKKAGVSGEHVFETNYFDSPPITDKIYIRHFHIHCEIQRERR
jgi:hypothetical protein